MPLEGEHIPGFTHFELDALAEIVAFSQKNGYRIKREYKKLSYFYKNNPDLLFTSLHDTKAELEEKKSHFGLTEFEELSLKEIKGLLDNNTSIQDMFMFNEDFFLDDYRKVFRQILKKDRNLLITTQIVDIIYYALNEDIEKGIEEGELLSNGSINTGSKIIIKILKVNHAEVVSKYQILSN